MQEVRGVGFDLVDEAEGKEFSMYTSDSQLMAKIPGDSARAVFW